MLMPFTLVIVKIQMKHIKNFLQAVLVYIYGFYKTYGKHVVVEVCAYIVYLALEYVGGVCKAHCAASFAPLERYVGGEGGAQ